MGRITIKKCPNDKFYTDIKIAGDCIQTLWNFIDDVNEFVFIEPSAGSGSFSDQLNNCFAFDLFPDKEYIIQQDFLLLDDFVFDKSICFIGNPPFGERNHLSKAFIKKATTFKNVKFIAFVLPKAYNKYTMQTIFPSDWSLISNSVLPKDSFLFRNQTYHVPCVFQIWEKNSSRANLREVLQGTDCQDFFFCAKNVADLFVFGAAPKKIIAPKDVTRKNRGYFLKSKIDLGVLCSRIQSVDWEKHAASSVSGGVAWFPKNDFMKFYLETHGTKNVNE